MKEAKPGPKKKAAEKKPTNTTSTETRKTASNEPESSKPQKDSGDASSTSQAPVIDQQPQLPATHGKMGVFGGPKDRGIKPDDKLALPTGPHGVYERIRSLNPKGFYCAMRWNYHVEHLTPEEVKRWWANRKLVVTNPKNGNAIVRAVLDLTKRPADIRHKRKLSESRLRRGRHRISGSVTRDRHHRFLVAVSVMVLV
jgi:hypothetical protein